MHWIKKHGATLLLCLVFIIGIGLIAYPSAADYYNSWLQRNAISSYAETVTALDTDRYEELRESAEKYNGEIAKHGLKWTMTDRDKETYDAVLKVSESSAMGYIEIPKIHEKLVIYHGTDENVLKKGVGHMEGTSFPIGSETSHCVLSGHRGLPSAKLFSDLDRLVVGDTFILSVLDMTLTYEVDQIHIVNPDDLTEITLEEGKDYCTLETCTPYGVNTHRLLVRGHRVDNPNGDANVIADALQIEPIYIAPFVAAPMLVLLFILLMVTTRRGAGKREKQPYRGNSREGHENEKNN